MPTNNEGVYVREQLSLLVQNKLPTAYPHGVTSITCDVCCVDWWVDLCDGRYVEADGEFLSMCNVVFNDRCKFSKFFRILMLFANVESVMTDYDTMTVRIWFRKGACALGIYDEQSKQTCRCVQVHRHERRGQDTVLAL